MTLRLLFPVLFLAIVAIWPGRGVPEEPADAPASAPRAQRMTYLKARAAEFELFKGDDRAQPLPVTREPLLRYSNPVRGFNLSDGATFLWLDGERPLAVAAWSIRLSPNRVYREFTSLSAEPLVCRFEGTDVWTPQTGGLLNQALPKADPPHAAAPRRLAQMRTLAGRFSAVVFREGAPTELRLMSQPFYRYKKESPEVLDGGLFSFAEATDPEALLLLEARPAKTKGTFEWRYTLARMTSLPLVMRLDDTEIWSVENFWKMPRSRDDPYFEANAGPYTPAGDQEGSDK